MAPRMFLARLRGLFAARRGDARIEDEIQSHVELAASDYQRRGMTAPKTARIALASAASPWVVPVA